VGRRRIEPVLRARRIRRIDVLVLSHADSDHVNAAPHLLRRFRVGALVVPPGFSRSPAGERVLALARRRGVPTRVAAAGTDLAPFGRVLHPPAGSDLSDNDGSLVLRVRLADRAVLLTGDLEAEGCARLLGSGVPVRADALLLPHHGGRNPGLAALVRAVGARALLVSAGPGFPAEPSVAGFPRWRTSDLGALTVVPSADGIRVSGFLESRPASP
jgi:competence protein ComEC